MLDLTPKIKQEDIKKQPSFIYVFSIKYYKKIFLYGSILFVSYEILFEPTFVGGMIGQWIHDFIGTLVNKSKF